MELLVYVIIDVEFGGWEGEQTGDNTHLPASNTIVCMPGASTICKSQCTTKATPRYKPAFFLAHQCSQEWQHSWEKWWETTKTLWLPWDWQWGTSCERLPLPHCPWGRYSSPLAFYKIAQLHIEDKQISNIRGTTSTLDMILWIF